MNALQHTRAAAETAGIDATDMTLIRDGSNAVVRLPHHVVARVGPPGTTASAARQVHVARWLADSGITVVMPLASPPQPTLVDDRPVTWWTELPDHRQSSPAELGTALQALHRLPPPPRPALPPYDGFAGIGERIASARHLDPDDRHWLADRLAQLRRAVDALDLHRTTRVLHGDAWQGNLVVPLTGCDPVLLDLDHVSLGHPAWDLVPLAADHADFARITDADYHSFVTAYGGHDITATPLFRTLADVAELRWTAFVLGKTTNPEARQETRHRIACLRGHAPRPWTWTAF
ncbi:phosphotransferase family protein [Amycolatopsis sp. VS8301801F10]|uniref:phosphotransferase family protein n=1 Tax=Amycolatopsis sp. VS8301801F10 TaxID=2652442 RepID=UPI0038FCB638